MTTPITQAELDAFNAEVARMRASVNTALDVLGLRILARFNVTPGTGGSGGGTTPPDPGATIVTAVAGDGVVDIKWKTAQAPAGQPQILPPLTYTVARDGKDSTGFGPWSASVGHRPPCAPSG